MRMPLLIKKLHNWILKTMEFFQENSFDFFKNQRKSTLFYLSMSLSSEKNEAIVSTQVDSPNEILTFLRLFFGNFLQAQISLREFEDLFFFFLLVF
jgi:DNA repair protein RadC